MEGYLIVFLASAFVLFYVIAGYPLLLDLMARLWSKPVTKRPHFPGVTVLLVIYNGEKWIRAKLNTILEMEYPRELMQILVVSDGSTDRTDAIAGEFPGVEAIHVSHRGKAAALNAGMLRARGEVIFFVDARQKLDRGCLRHLTASLADPEVGCACGQIRFLEKGEQEAHLGLYWRYERWIRRNLSRLSSILAGTGYVYAVRRELVPVLPCGLLDDDLYIPLKLIQGGYRCIFDEEAIAYEYALSRATEFRRKMRTLAGLYQVMPYFPGMLIPFRAASFHFLSYKAGRLVLPFALIACGVSAFGLPGAWAPVAVGAQAAFYAVAASGWFLPKGSHLKRLSEPMAAFLVMMAAALCAVRILFQSAESLWKTPTDV